jgi:hypothetical protein
MSVTRTAAAREEEAELNQLRDQADRTAADAAQALAELTRRIDVARRPGEAVRRLTADARAAARRALRGPGSATVQRGPWRPALAAVPVLALAAALAYAAARGKIIFRDPERVRALARSAKLPRPR